MKVQPWMQFNFPYQSKITAVGIFNFETADGFFVNVWGILRWMNMNKNECKVWVWLDSDLPCYKAYQFSLKGYITMV